MIILLGNMLFPDHSALPIANTSVFMAEDWGLCTHFKYHKHKLILVLAAMRHHRDALRERGVTVEYAELTANGQTSYEAKLAEAVERLGVQKIETYTIEDHCFRQRIQRFCKTHKLELIFHDSPLFLTTLGQFQEYRSQHKRLFMADFYKRQRQRLDILVHQNGKPLGGKWSFDQQNRQPLPDSVQVSPMQFPKPTQHVWAISKLVDQLFRDHPGESQDFWLPVTRNDARIWLQAFLCDRLGQFGPYEDALSTQEPFVFHSVLSPLMNLGLLIPGEVINAALDYAAKNDLPLNSLEGFIRQIIGWREYIRGVYQAIGVEQATQNVLGHKRRLTEAWYEGTTGLPPVDLVIQRVRQRGWAHHIERLMVISNAMLLAEIHPDQVYQWFMELFVDAYDWVMVPNVYGMGQFADGGLMMTKPYVSGSNYLLKMGDFQKGEWCDTWNGLYWRFIDQKRDMLTQIPRMSMAVRTFEQMNQARKSKILAAAEEFIQEKTS